MTFVWSRRRASDAGGRDAIRVAGVLVLALAVSASADAAAAAPVVALAVTAAPADQAARPVTPLPIYGLPLPAFAPPTVPWAPPAGAPLPGVTIAPAAAGLSAANAQGAGAVSTRVVVVLAPGVDGVREQAALREDLAWLGGPGRRGVPALAAADTAGVAVSGAADDAADALRADLKRRLWLAAAARGDTVAALRGLPQLVRDRWQARGWLQADVRARGDTVVVAPGRPWTYGPWTVEGDPFPGRERLLADWLPPAGSRFDAARFDAGARGLLAELGERGHPFPRWVVSDLRLDAATSTISVAASLLPGARAVIGPVTGDLADPRAARFLVRASGLRPGAPLRGSDLRRAVERLWARELYAMVDTPRVYATTAVDTVGVHLPAQLRPRVNRLQVVLGLSRRQPDTPARLSGEVDLRLPNLASSGRALHVGWRDDGASRSRFGFSWLEPLAFGTPLDVVLALDSEVQQDAYTRFSVDLAAQLPVIALWGVEFGLGSDRSTFPTGDIARTDRTRARAALAHRRGDRARDGWEGTFALESAWRSAVAREGAAGSAVLGAETRQRILHGDVAGELWLGRQAAVAGRLTFRQLNGAEREAPLSEQFRLGGAASVRGYGEGEFHGVETASASLEWRLGPARGSRLYTFYDLGYFEFWSAATNAESAPERHRGWPRGYGLGLLARTPGGDLSLAIGFPGTVDFDLAKLHVTLLESF